MNSICDIWILILWTRANNTYTILFIKLKSILPGKFKPKFQAASVEVGIPLPTPLPYACCWEIKNTKPSLCPVMAGISAE
jgi:hypothetical protein